MGVGFPNPYIFLLLHTLYDSVFNKRPKIARKRSSEMKLSYLNTILVAIIKIELCSDKSAPSIPIHPPFYPHKSSINIKFITNTLIFYLIQLQMSAVNDDAEDFSTLSLNDRLNHKVTEKNHRTFDRNKWVITLIWHYILASLLHCTS
jgi:hypothetical protein